MNLHVWLNESNRMSGTDEASQSAASVTRNRCIKLRVTCRYENSTSLRTFSTPEVNNVWKNSVFS